MSLSDSPNEIILLVFKSFDKINYATTFSQISPRFNKIWKSNLGSICDAILSRTIECYDEVYNLWETESNIPVKSSTVRSPPVASSLSINEDADAAFSGSEKHQAETELAVARTQIDEANVSIAISKAEYLCAQAAIADSYLETFRISVSYVEWWLQGQYGYDGTYSSYRKQFTLTSASRTYFLKDYLRARRMMCLAVNDRTKMFTALAALRLLNFFRMLEIMEWMIDNSYLYLVGGRMTEDAKHISECYRTLAYLEIDLARVTGIKRPIDEFGARSPSLPLFINQDSIRDQTDRAAGINLANVLPLVPETDSVDARTDLVLPFWLKCMISGLKMVIEGDTTVARGTAATQRL